MIKTIISDEDLPEIDTDGEFRDDMFSYFVVNDSLIKPFYESIKNFLMTDFDYSENMEAINSDEKVIEEFNYQYDLEAITNEFTGGFHECNPEDLLNEVEHD